MCVMFVWRKKNWGYFCLQGKCKKKKGVFFGWIIILFFRNDMKMNVFVEEFFVMEFIYIVILSINSQDVFIILFMCYIFCVRVEIGKYSW